MPGESEKLTQRMSAERGLSTLDEGTASRHCEGMDVEHHLTFHANEATRERLRLVGFTASLGLNTLVVREGDPRWAALSSLLGSLDAVETRSARFSRRELDCAQLLGLSPDWHHGYPQPEADFGYRSATYDLSAYCLACGGGADQIAPFRMRSEPRWGRRSILQLNWIFGEYFVTPHLWERVFMPIGVNAREVLSARSLKPLATVLQLVIQATCDLATDGLAFEDCTVCRRRRYLPIQGDYLPAVTNIDSELAKSRQSFGSGASNWKRIICNQHLRRTLLEEGVKGVSFLPCRS